MRVLRIGICVERWGALTPNIKNVLRPIANEYREGKLKSTLGRELKAPETKQLHVDAAPKNVLIEGNEIRSQCCVVRHEARARELFSVASLRSSTFVGVGQPKTAHVKRRVVLTGHKSQGLDLKPDDLLVNRMKSSFKGMEVRNRC